jgi:serine/threonine protein kinase
MELSRARQASGSILTQAEEQQYKWAVHKSDLHMVARLGAGAYGEVWAGRWRRNDVAVKLLTRSEDSDHGKHDFLREMQLLSELRHPNIVRFLGACLDRQNMCILFEICERSLYDLLYKSGAPTALFPSPFSFISYFYL